MFNEFDNSQLELQKVRDYNKSQGIKMDGRAPKPIISPLEKDLYVSAYFEGVVKEHEVLSKFNKKNIDELIYG